MSGNKTIRLWGRLMLLSMSVTGTAVAAVTAVEKENQSLVMQQKEGGEAFSVKPNAEAEAQSSVKSLTEAEEEQQQPLVWPQAETVSELLQKETHAALLRQRQQTHAAIAADPTAIAEVAVKGGRDHIELLAIYGVGKKLNVEILINGKRRFYRSGSKWPNEVHDRASAYALQSITGRCVTLEGNAETRFVCLSAE